MAIDQQWIGDIPRYYGQFIYIDIVYVIDQRDASALSCVGWLHDPNIFLAIVLLQLLIMLIKLTELIWQDVGVRYKVKMLFAESLLHSDNVEAKPVFPCNFVTLREVVNLLVLVQAFVQVALAAG